MNLSEIDYGTIGEDELYKNILLNSGVNDFFINTPYTYACLKPSLKYAISQNGLEQITSEEDANRLVNSIRENWTIKDDTIIGQLPVEIGDSESNLQATNVKKYKVNQIKRLSNNQIKNSILTYTMQSEFAPEAQDIRFEDMSDILYNDNRIQEDLDEFIYEMSENGMTEISRTAKGKISTLDKGKFAELQQNIGNQDWEEVLNYPDEYYPRISKATQISNTNMIENLQQQSVERERRQYTDEEYSKMAERVMNNTGLNETKNQNNNIVSQTVQKYGEIIGDFIKRDSSQNTDILEQREEVIKQALLELGLSERLYGIDQSTIKNMAYKSMQNNDQIGDLTNQNQIEQLLRQLNKDLVIEENYIIGNTDSEEKRKFHTKLHQYASTPYEEKPRWKDMKIDQLTPEEYNHSEVAEIYIDKADGLIHKNIIATSPGGIISRESIAEGSLYNMLSQITKANNLQLTPEEYREGNLFDLDVSTALAIKNRPNKEWEVIKTDNNLPDICIEQRREEGRKQIQEERAAKSSNKSNEVNIEVANGIESPSNDSNQHAEKFEEANGEITETDLAEAILLRKGITENGTISVMVGNSKKITISVEPYIQGDAESENARAANEEERSRQTQQTQTEDLTK